MKFDLNYALARPDGQLCSHVFVLALPTAFRVFKKGNARRCLRARAARVARAIAMFH